ncbi:MAG: MFS transporter [Chloroflexota bacterium]
MHTFKTMLGTLQGNARIIVLTEAISAIPFQWQRLYMPLYMLALGVGEIEVGLLASALFAMRFVGTLFGGYAADRFGRKRVLVVFDIVSWSIPMLLFAIAQNPLYFLIGQLLNGFVYIVLPSFDCLFVEDVPEKNRTGVFGSLALFTAAASLLAPVGGFLIEQWGIVTGGRIIMWVTFASTFSVAIIRQITLRETSMGNVRMAEVQAKPPLVLVAEYAQTIRHTVQNNAIRNVLSIRILQDFSLIVWTTYAAIYMTDQQGLALSEGIIAYLPFIGAIVVILILTLAAKRMQSDHTFVNLSWGQGIWLVGAISFVLSPMNTIWFVIIWAIGDAICQAIFQPALQSHWANIVDDKERAQVFSASSALIMLCIIPAGPLAGALYQLWPQSPFILAIGLQVIVFVLIVLGKHHTHTDSQSQS